MRHRAIELLRQRRAGPAGSPSRPAPADMAGVHGRPTLAVDAGVARQALADLPPVQRQVMQLAYFEGLPLAEIGKRLGVPEKTIRARLRFAVDRLGNTLGFVTAR